MRPATTSGSIVPRTGVKPQPVTGSPSSWMSLVHTAATAPTPGTRGETEGVAAAAVVGGGGIEVRVASLEVPRGAEEPWCRDEVIEARREHEDRGDTENTEHGTEVRGTDRHRGPAASGFEGHAQTVRRGGCHACPGCALDDLRRSPPGPRRRVERRPSGCCGPRRGARSPRRRSRPRGHPASARPSRRGSRGRDRHGGRHRRETAATRRQPRATARSPPPAAMSSACGPLINTRWGRVTPSDRSVS